MNDFLETSWIYKHINKVKKELRTKENDLYFLHLEELKNYYMNPHLLNPARIPFICAFSSCGDLLSQWRSYADDATGFAIGFDLEDMKIHLSAQSELHKGIRLEEVIYDEDRQFRYVKKIIENYLTSDKNEILGNSRECSEKLFQLASTIKNPKFIEEKEWRIIYVPEISKKEGTYYINDKKPAKEFKFDLIGHNIKAHFLMNIPNIKKLYCGPRNIIDPLTLDGFLDFHGYSVAEIEFSAASLR